MKVLLLSHGSFAKEVYNTAKMIMGEIKNVDYITLEYGEDTAEYKKRICEIVDSSDQTLILCDLFGGSPFMISSQIFGDPKYNARIELVTGLNLPMFLEVASQLPYSTLSSLREIAVNAGVQGVTDLRKRLEG